jgi:ATP-dependent DNA helicase RecG
MQEQELTRLVEKIRVEKCEGQRIEVKKASEGCPSRLYDTLSSFSNQNTGGVIVFGLDEEAGFAVTGVYDVQDLQHRVTQQCAEMEPVVRALFTSVEIDGKMVVSAEIPPVDVVHRPVFYRGRGRIGGAFVRVGDADERMTEFEIYSYEAYRNHSDDERRIVEDADLSLFDEKRVGDYVRAIKANRPHLAALISDDEMPEKMGIVKDGHPSVAGLMVFSACPQTVFPQLCVTAVVVPGERIGATGGDGVRFAENRQITGAIPEMLEEAVGFVARTTGRANTFTKDGKRVDRTEYPMLAVREAILNALIHRDYSRYTETCPVRVEIYPDRLEISNKGGLYGEAPIAALGRIDIGKRNPLIVDMLECLGKTENRNSGIAVMRAECEANNLPLPAFSVTHGEFKVVFRNRHPADEVAFNRHDAAASLLAFCEMPRTRDELAAFTGRTRSYTMAYLVKPLFDDGRLVRTNPGSPKDQDQRFVKAGAFP